MLSILGGEKDSVVLTGVVFPVERTGLISYWWKSIGKPFVRLDTQRPGLLQEEVVIVFSFRD